MAQPYFGGYRNPRGGGRRNPLMEGFQAGEGLGDPFAKRFAEDRALKARMQMAEMARAQRVADAIQLAKMKNEMALHDPYRQNQMAIANSRAGLGSEGQEVPTAPAVPFTETEQRMAINDRREAAGMPPILADEQPAFGGGAKSSKSANNINVPRGTNSQDGEPPIEITHTVDSDGPKTTFKSKVNPSQLPAVWEMINKSNQAQGAAAGKNMDKALHENDPLADYPTPGNALGMMKNGYSGGGTLADKESAAASGAIPESTSGRDIPPQEAVDYLQKNPHLADEFNAKYGDGAADQYLNASMESDNGQ